MVCVLVDKGAFDDHSFERSENERLLNLRNVDLIGSVMAWANGQQSPIATFFVLGTRAWLALNKDPIALV